MQPSLVQRLRDSVTQCRALDRSQLLTEAADEIERLRDAIRRLAEQDATLSVCEGNVTVTLDATLTGAEREADEKTTAEPSGASGGSQAWIPVTERLPDDGADVMGFALPDYTNLARYDAVEGRFWCVTGGWFNPTHWMPLPAPPTDDK